MIHSRMGRGAEGGGWQDDGKISSYPRQNLQGTGVQTREPPSDRWAKKEEIAQLQMLGKKSAHEAGTHRMDRE